LATLLDLASDMMGQIPGLSHLFARKFVNRALEDLQRDYLWSWNVGEGILITPQQVTASGGGGTVQVTQFSATIQFDATAQITLNALSNANPPIIKYQFRVGAGPIYSLIAYNTGSGVGTLDRIYTEASGSGLTYQCYRCYYDPPSEDGVTTNNNFVRYLSIQNPINGYTITGRRLYMSLEELNRRDPLRGAQGLPYYAVAHKPTPQAIQGSTDIYNSSNGQMLYELWPHPTYSQALICQFVKMHQNLQPSDQFPAQLSLSTLQYRALEYGYRWAMQNAGRIPELKGVDWRFLLGEVQVKYSRELVGAKRQDKEIALTVLRPGTAGLYDFWGPIDSSFFQSHGLPAL
jgi:hypothetical protein